jgi:hypothetical protein
MSESAVRTEQVVRRAAWEFPPHWTPVQALTDGKTPGSVVDWRDPCSWRCSNLAVDVSSDTVAPETDRTGITASSIESATTMADNLEPPYGEIAELLSDGEVIPFLGAGVNYGVRPPQSSWNAAESSFPPDGAELSRFLAEKVNFPADEDLEIRDLAKVSSYYVEISSRRRLRKLLRGTFEREWPVSDIHTYLAEVPAPLLIMTTNYDDLMERALARANRPYDVVIHVTDRKDYANAVAWWKHQATEPIYIEPNKLNLDMTARTVVYKMHGTFDRASAKLDSYVITEEDYVEFLSRMTSQRAVPSAFMRHIRSRRFLFLGYSLRDWNLRVVLKNLRETNREPDGDESDDDGLEQKSWAIQRHPSRLEQTLWDARRVRIFDVDLAEFVRQLRARART